MPWRHLILTCDILLFLVLCMNSYIHILLLAQNSAVHIISRTLSINNFASVIQLFNSASLVKFFVVIAILCFSLLRRLIKFLIGIFLISCTSTLLIVLWGLKFLFIFLLVFTDWLSLGDTAFSTLPTASWITFHLIILTSTLFSLSNLNWKHSWQNVPFC